VKRMLVIWLMLMSGSALAGCRTVAERWRNPPAAPPASPTTSESPRMEQPAGPAQATPTNVAGPVTITYWEDDSDEGAVVLDELAADFMEANSGIQVERVHFSTEDLRQQYRVAVLEGNPPELVRGAGELAGSFGELETVRPLEGLIPQSTLDQFFPGALAAARVKGRLWGVPDNYGNHLMLIYNKKWVKEVPPDTGSWVAQLKTLTDSAQNQYGLVYDLKEPFWLVPWLGGFDGWPLDEAGRPALASEPMANTLQFLQDLKLVHKVVPPDVNYDSAYEIFRSGKAAYVIDGAWNLDRYRGAGVDFGVAALPKVTRTGLYPSPLTLGKYWFISKDSKGPQLDAAVKFVEFMTSAGAQEAWASKAGRLPSNQEAAKSEVIVQDPVKAGSMDQLSKGHGLLSVPEMYCAWSAIRAPLAGVMDGSMIPAAAGQAMQDEAERCIASMNVADTGQGDEETPEGGQ
jgi:arabinogalactan oligomer / maltooligosaccharide transport system substrate-binding protein